MRKQTLKLSFDVYDDLTSEQVAAYRWLVVMALQALAKSKDIERNSKQKIMVDRMLHDWDEDPGRKELYERRRAAWESIEAGKRAGQELAKIQQEIEEIC